MSPTSARPIAVTLRWLLFALFFYSIAPTAKAQEATVVCPTCGQVMPAKFHFCGNCGTSLDGVAKPETKADGAPMSSEKKKPSFFDMFHLGMSSKKPEGEQSSAFSDTPLPLKTIPDRPKPIIEIGQNPFLDSGTIAPGYILPTGAVWQPDFIVYGTGRSAFQVFDNGKTQISEEVNSLELLGNLYLTPTERIVAGIRPFEVNGQFAGYRYFPDPKLVSPYNGNLHTLFFEGDFGELFPKLDINDTKSIDYGFAVGRQPLNIEDGIMINNDAIDAASITRTSLFGLGSSALRTTLLFGWNDVNRNDDITDNKSKLIGLFTSADYTFGTVDFDSAYVNSRDSSGLDFGAGVTNRFWGLLNSTFRVNTSFALDQQSAAVSTGTLLTSQLSTVLPYGADVVYLDTFWGIDNYASADRGPDAAGPLGTIGILFAAQDLGNYVAPLGDRPNSSVGGSLGFQKYLGSKDRQLVLEIGGKLNTRTPAYFADTQPSDFGAAARYQMKLNQHFVLILDTFVGFPEDRNTSYGFRAELLYKF
jgi:hypothetical protein